MNYLLLILLFIGLIAFAFTLVYFCNSNKYIKKEMQHWQESKFWNDFMNNKCED